MKPGDFEFLKLIGRGTFGRVFQVRKKDTRRIYAMKVLSKKEIVAKKEVAHTIGERKILQRSLECPFLVGLKFSFQTEKELYFVTDYKCGGELFWHLQKEGRFSEDRARFYIAELILALEHLHKYNIVYRYVATAVALFNNADLSQAILNRKTSCSTPLVTSPSAISDCRSPIFPTTSSQTRSAARPNTSLPKSCWTRRDMESMSISGHLVSCCLRCVADGHPSMPSRRRRCTG